MIRPANLEDVPDIITLLRACDLFNDALDYSEWSHPTLVCERDGRIVGLCQVLLGQPYAYMTEIGVHPDYQDKGIGHELVKEMEKILRDCGIKYCGGIILDTNENSRVRAEHAGFERKGHGYSYLKEIK